ncbi:endoglucanase 12 [Amborella trichopoda]|uniref:Endoglucanase n=1 Tax=Amborella trichopoda TaxID=13333 RepID=U5DDA8_AMBTC|nr:endoglucanase 12 [Amborella trichopoda]ERN20205.1 hypothetical protein AMTR_s00066p00128970 [Amborella trichopoda]|eukprot:XP_006858738.1 endoglucanase 12 [Amborella trichopoda]
MHGGNHWGGSFEIHGDSATDDERSRNMDIDRAALSHHSHSQNLDETQQSWLLGPSEPKKNKYIDLGCVVCSRKAFRYSVWTVVIALVVIVLPIVIVKSLPKHHPKPPKPDNYTLALHKALMFFNAQKSGRLPRSNGVPWRHDSGLQDGSDAKDVKGGLVGGYYDAGDNIKFGFPMAFSMSMLGWTVVEYAHKYKAIGEYDHVRELIRWGTDYILQTFNSSSNNINHIYSQVGSARNGSTTPDDHYCWERPEDMDYPRRSLASSSAPDLGAEMAAALSAASIVFRDDPVYSERLSHAAETVFKFARDQGHRNRYSAGNPDIEPFYNSTDYFDEHMWGAAWLYYATGNSSYLALATNPGIARNAHNADGGPDKGVLSWDNKIPAAQLLLLRLRMFLNPGYPYEEMLKSYSNITGLYMCSYLKRFNVFNFTQGGLIQLNHGRPQTLQYAANAAFLANLYADYMNATGVPGWFCGPYYFSAIVLRQFAQSQINYILGDNPRKMSYVVGYGSNYPKHVHHRGASIPNNQKTTCTGGWKWRDSNNPNPNTITGAMVGGPDRFDQFRDVRSNYNYTEPTLAGNAGLVAALISLTGSGGGGIDTNKIFSGIPPLFPVSPPPPPPWKP